MPGSTYYSDPSATSTEVLIPTGINIAAVPFAVCLIGTGSRTKRVVAERILRGAVTDEAIVPDSGGPYTAALDYRGDKRSSSTTVYRTLNGITTPMQSSYVSYDPAYVLSTVTGTVDLDPDAAAGSRLNAFGLEMDGKEAVTIAMFDTFVRGAGANVVATIDGDELILTPSVSPTFYTKGVRVGMTATLSLSEDGANDGDWVITDVSETAISMTNADGVANAADSAMVITINGVGISGREITVMQAFGGTNAATASQAEIATAVNAALDGAAALGFGDDYSACATTSSGSLKITSQVASPSSASDVRVFAPIDDSGLSVIFGAPAADLSNRDAVTYVTLSASVWNALATWTIDYARVDDNTDPLANDDVASVTSVGSAPGSTYYTTLTDWVLTGDEIDFSPDAAATMTGVLGSGSTTFDINPTDTLVLRMDGKLSAISGTTSISINLADLDDAPIGWTAPGDLDAATPAEVAANINAVLAQHLGPRYATVASVSSNKIVLTSPIAGQASSSIEVVDSGTAASAHIEIFGGTQLALGTGKRPAPGSYYFVTYDFTRPSDEYDVPVRHFSPDAAKAQVGGISAATAAYNPLALAAELAFRNGAQFIYTCQVDDTDEGNPTRSEVLSALDAAGTSALTTEIVVVGEPGTRLAVMTDMVDHLETQCGTLEKHYRRAFFGMASSTEIGDRDTDGSIISLATSTLQVSPTSPARGRMFCIAPPQLSGVSYDATLDDGTVARLSLDATYLAVAVAARRTSLDGPAETLTRKTITGFNTDDITAPWKPAERRLMAANGVLVVTYEDGRFRMMDAMSTEGGGGNKDSFKVDSTSYQKDIVVSKVDAALDANIVGIVPFDLATFLLDIKLVIQSVITAEISAKTIGPYRNADGSARLLDPRTDIRVAQDPNTATKFTYKYWFYLRYPALRLEGEYSVDQSFFSLGV